MDKIQEFRKIVGEMADTYEKKNENYGDSFGQLCEDLGPIAGLVPLYNKIHRATSLVKSGKNHYENLEDTFIDLACYAIMNVIEMRNKKEKECSSENEARTPESDNREGCWDESKKVWISPDDKYSVRPIVHRSYGDGLVYSSPCHECGRHFIAGACDGCPYNIVLTNGGNN